MPSTVTHRRQTRGEEIANTISHGLAALAAVIATPVLVIAAVQQGGTADVVGASIFGLSMLVLYLSSTLYHAVPHGTTKRRLKVVDHAAIFILIAGTYTPFTLGVLRGGWGWTIFGLVWGLAIAGVLLKTRSGARGGWISTLMYVAIGWLAVIAIKPLLTHVPTWGIIWLLAGGLSYTGGVVFYMAKQRRYSHFAWHLCVMAGTAFHFVAVLEYARPPSS